MTVLSLQKGILYGPVASRRLGRSLGINLMPVQYKLCSFNCVYCHYGWTEVCTGEVKNYVKDLPLFNDVVKAVEGVLQSPLQFDFLTFSGNGEPTLYPGFAELVDEVVRLKKKYRPELKVALLSNSTGLVHREVREVIKKIDLPVFKFDVGTEEKFNDINRPAPGINFNDITEMLCSLKDIYIQTVLMDGSPTNVNETDLTAYFEKIGRIRPNEVQVYSLDRPVPNTRISRVSPEKLEQIARQGEATTGITIKPFYLH